MEEKNVKCPLLGNSWIDIWICFDIHGVVEETSPKNEAPEKIGHPQVRLRARDSLRTCTYMRSRAGCG